MSASKNVLACREREFAKVKSWPKDDPRRPGMLRRKIKQCCNAIRRGDMESAKYHWEVAHYINPNDSDVMWLWDNFYPDRGPAVSPGAAYWEGRILARQEAIEILEDSGW